MKIKVILILLILYFASGCAVEYNLNIDQNTVSESININGTTSKENTQIEKYVWDQPAFYNETGSSEVAEKLPNVEYYDKKLNKNSGYSQLNFKYDFSVTGYKKSNATSRCYKNFSFFTDSSSIVISTNNYNTCFDNYPTLDKIVINITTTYPVQTHNADSYSNDKYTWTISRVNYKNKVIRFEMSNDAPAVSNINPERDEKTPPTVFIIIGVGLVCFAIAIGIIVRIKRKRL